jgi:hypothetical protein
MVAGCETDRWSRTPLDNRLFGYYDAANTNLFQSGCQVKLS